MKNMNNQKEFKATQKYLLMSPRKVRLVVGVIKKMKPAEAVEKLPFVQKRAAGDLGKVFLIRIWFSKKFKSVKGPVSKEANPSAAVCGIPSKEE